MEILQRLLITHSIKIFWKKSNFANIGKLYAERKNHNEILSFIHSNSKINPVKRQKWNSYKNSNSAYEFDNETKIRKIALKAREEKCTEAKLPTENWYSTQKTTIKVNTIVNQSFTEPLIDKTSNLDVTPEMNPYDESAPSFSSKHGSPQPISTRMTTILYNIITRILEMTVNLHTKKIVNDTLKLYPKTIDSYLTIQKMLSILTSNYLVFCSGLKDLGKL